MAAGVPGHARLWERLTSTALGSLLRDDPDHVGLIPVGATEQHGPHLPTGTDTLIARGICEQASRQCGALVLPEIPVGCSFGHGRQLPGTLSLSPAQLAGLVQQMVDWAAASGLRRLLFVNAHVGNVAPLMAATDPVRLERPDVRVGVVSWWTMSDALAREAAADGADWPAMALPAGRARRRGSKGYGFFRPLPSCSPTWSPAAVRRARPFPDRCAGRTPTDTQRVRLLTCGKLSSASIVAMSADVNVTAGPPGEVPTSLHRGTDWRGAFVIGLAGVILVTGIVPFAVQAMGAAAIPAIIGIQVVAMAVCLCMGELAALYPHRTGGTPSYAYESFKPLGESVARHIGGVSGWSYWLGWFPVAPINMILAAFYIATLFHVPLGRQVDPLGSLGTPTGIGVLAITMVGLVVLFIPCYLGIRLGAGFATLFGLISMVPLTLLIILPVFKPSTFHWSNVAGFHFADPKTSGVAFFLSWLFVISWNGIGVEAAACYVAECRDPHRDAKLALTAEGLYGLFIYAATAIVFVAVLGAALTTSDPLTLYTSFADHIFGSAHWVKYVIGIPLIGALLLSVLNAIMGVARSLFQASEDRLIPKWFAHTNKHLVPDRAMFFNLICAMIVALFGSPVRIYIFSNVGYLLAIIVALLGYFMVRQFRKDQVSPFRMPGFFRWIALLMGLGLTFVYFAGGWGSPDIVVGPGQGHTLYILGFAVVAAYVPLHLWRRMTDRRDGVAPLGTLPIVVGSPGGIDLDGMREPHVLDPDHMDAIDAEAAGIRPIPDTAPEVG